MTAVGDTTIRDGLEYRTVELGIAYTASGNDFRFVREVRTTSVQQTAPISGKSHGESGPLLSRSGAVLPSKDQG